jgi:hypothetical protein
MLNGVFYFVEDDFSPEMSAQWQVLKNTIPSFDNRSHHFELVRRAIHAKSAVTLAVVRNPAPIVSLMGLSAKREAGNERPHRYAQTFDFVSRTLRVRHIRSLEINGMSLGIPTTILPN